LRDSEREGGKVKLKKIREREDKKEVRGRQDNNKDQGEGLRVGKRAGKRMGRRER